MRKNFGKKTGLYPQPVFIISSYDEENNANCMNAAWAGISDYGQISIAMSSHKTLDNILKTKALTIQMGTVDTVVSCDYVGLVSGNDVTNKMEKAKFTTTRSEFVNAPIINELPLAIECELHSYNEETEILKATIINVSCDERYLTDGKIDVNKIKPITYDSFNHTYVALGEVVAKAFKCGNELKDE